MQGSILATMVVLEVVLVAASIWFAHRYLVQMIDDSMYRMSIDQSGPTFMRLAEKGLAVLGLFLLINVIALTAAAAIWSRHENRVLQDFTLLLAKTRKLDFSSDPEPHRQHEVLALAAAWRARERTRFAAIHDQLAQLEAAVSAGADATGLRDRMRGLNQLLS